MAWLITGGAGYIGAHVVDALIGRGEQVVVLDDLSTGAADRIPGAQLVEGSITDRAAIAAAFAAAPIEGVLHLAARKQVGESVERPLWYYEQNVEGLRLILDAMVVRGVNRLLFSSSAATYGMPDVELVTEDTETEPLSPYGETKLVGEWMVNDVVGSSGLRAVSLRYFNVAGAARPNLADPAALNLIPMVFEAIYAGRAPQIFGDDYPTPDGTCIRDYVHVADLADAHVEVLLRIDDVATGAVYNVGTGLGSSVRQVIDTIHTVIGRDVGAIVAPRRAGDPARVVASVERIRSDLGWSARFDLEAMVRSAWEGWVRTHGPLG